MTSSRLETLDRLARVAGEMEWIVSRVAPEHELPARPIPGDWNIRQILAHMVMCEGRYVLPTLRLLAAGRDAIDLPMTGNESGLQEMTEELAQSNAAGLWKKLQEIEGQREKRVREMSDEDFGTPRMTAWGRRTAQRKLEKSFGHYWEHGVTIFYRVHFSPRPN